MEITPLGDGALIVRVRDEFESAPKKTLNAVLTTQRRLEGAQLPGVIELAPAYTTIAVFYDPGLAINAGASRDNVVGWYDEKIREVVAKPHRLRRRRASPDNDSGVSSKAVEVPVCYEGEFAPDLDEIARHAGIASGEVVNLHCGAKYYVHCVGFTAGFPFLGGLPNQLATPRRSTPRKEIPAGAVGIGGAQTGIYPVKSPGGWNIIGRTPLRLFDPRKNPPALLRAGDRVRFRAITRDEFERFARSEPQSR